MAVDPGHHQLVYDAEAGTPTRSASGPPTGKSGNQRDRQHHRLSRRSGRNCRGLRLRALVRDPDFDPDRARLPTEVHAVRGDLTKPPALERADAIVFVHGSTGEAGARDTFYADVRDVLAVVGTRRVPVALMTAIAVTDRGRAHDWKRRAERLVRASGLPHLIVRERELA